VASLKLNILEGSLWLELLSIINSHFANAFLFFNFKDNESRGRDVEARSDTQIALLRIFYSFVRRILILFIIIK
jgi:hypothetical protein